MRRFLIAILMVGLILAMASTGKSSQVNAESATETATVAATDAATTLAPTTAGTAVDTSAASPTVVSTPVGTPEDWALSTLLRLKPGIPFAWLRSVPASSGKVVDTALPSDFLVVAGPVAADSTQYWWQVRRVGGSGTVGYVEEKSLQLAIGPTAIPTTAVPPTAVPTTAVPTTPAPTTPATAQSAEAWTVGSALHISGTIPYAWVRPVPKSSAAVLGSLLPLAKVTVASATPVYDGTQYWWAITVTASGLQGWVEQNSLVLDSAAPAASVTATSVPATTIPATATTVPTTPAPTASACGLSNTAEPWVALNVVSVKPCVSSLWVRNAPASSASVIGTVLPGRFLLLAGASKSDGTQIWWPVQIPETNIVGWVEQGALQLVGTPATNIAGTPAATATSLG